MYLIYLARLAAERAEVEAEQHRGGGDERPDVLVLVREVPTALGLGLGLGLGSAS